jgi:hypothetical protein
VTVVVEPLEQAPSRRISGFPCIVVCSAELSLRGAGS